MGALTTGRSVVTRLLGCDRLVHLAGGLRTGGGPTGRATQHGTTGGRVGGARRRLGRAGVAERLDLLLQPLHAGDEGFDIAACLVMGELHQHDFHQHSRVWCAAHVDQRGAELFDGPHEPGRTDLLSLQ